MKTVLRKIFKIIGYLLLGLVIMLSGVYIYLAMQKGEPAPERTIFKTEKPQPLVFAHRGGGGLFPENTLDAFEYSAKMGVDVLELDVHETSDGALVVLHDANVNRTTDGNGPVSQMTLAELKKLDAGFHFTPDDGASFPYRGQGLTVPTLEEIFTALPQMKYNIEPKQAIPSIIKPLCEMIRAHQMTDRVIVGSFRQTAVDEFRQACPEVATSATPAEASEFLAMYKTGISDSYRPPMQALQIPERLGYLNVVTKDFVDAAHRLNLQVHVWTINDPADMRRLLDAGVDGIMTDYPDKLLEILGRPPAK